MKKSRLYLIPILFLLSAFIVSAADSNIPWQTSSSNSFLSDNVNKAITIVIDFTSPVFGAIIGNNGEFFFERIILLFIILSVVYVALSRIPIFSENTAVIWVITIAVSIISTRFLTESQLINNILLPYTLFGVVITAVLPLVIFFFFCESIESTVLRKIMWIFFLIVFIGLWYERYDQLGQFSWIYFFTGIAALILLLADGTIRRAMVNQKMRELGNWNRSQYETDLRRQLDQARRDLSNNVISPAEYANISRKIKDQLKTLAKH